MMLFFYTVLYTILLPFILCRLYWKGIKLPAYRERWQERLGYYTTPAQAINIWIHAVSLGETIAATPLIEALLHANKSILITNTTVTGSQRSRQQFNQRIQQVYLPYDHPVILKRFFKQFQPQICLLMETELWPNLIYYTKKHQIQLLLINARLSESSYRHYHLVKALVKPMLQKIDSIHTQTAEDAQRFIALGANKKHVCITGNLKFDQINNQVQLELYNNLRKTWHINRFVVIAASTHDPEEHLLLQQWQQLKQNIPHILLFIAPRHPERFLSVYNLAKQYDQNVGLRSDSNSLHNKNQIVIVDTLGELLGFYHIAQLAFIGGSIAKIGGHNVLESIAMHTPTIVGPHTFHFTDIIAQLRQAQAIIEVDSMAGVSLAIQQLAHQPMLATRLATHALQLLNNNQGALDRYLQSILLCVCKSASSKAIASIS